MHTLRSEEAVYLFSGFAVHGKNEILPSQLFSFFENLSSTKWLPRWLFLCSKIEEQPVAMEICWPAVPKAQNVADITWFPGPFPELKSSGKGPGNKCGSRTIPGRDIGWVLEKNMVRGGQADRSVKKARIFALAKVICHPCYVLQSHE